MMVVNSDPKDRTWRPVTSPETLHGRIASDLRKSIKGGKYVPGDALPSEAQLGRDFEASRITVRHALSTLEQEGLIAAFPGRGRIVRSRQHMIYRPQQEKEPRKSGTMDRYMAALSSEGRTPSQSIDVAVIEAEGLVAERFGVEEGTPLVARKRVRSIDGDFFNINDTFYRYELAKDTDIMKPADVPRGSNSIIEDKIGKEARAFDEIYVRMPTPEEAQRLNLSSGTPVAVHFVTGYTAQDDVVRVEYFVLPGDRHVILYERVHPEEDA